MEVLLSEQDRRDIARYAREVAARDRRVPRKVRELLASKLTMEACDRLKAQRLVEEQTRLQQPSLGLL